MKKILGPLFACKLLLLGCVLVASAAPADVRRPNILWINAEDMSPHLGCYGDAQAITPNIDRLAARGIIYQNAFATAPICAPSRSCLATGLYATSLGTQHLRCEVEIPSRVKPLAVRMRELGYFCTNTGKSDYNFNPDGIWDEWSSAPAPWRKRRAGQPFFAFMTVGETHEGRINRPERYHQATATLATELRHDPDKVTLPPFYPDTPEIRAIFARMHDLATVFDQKVGNILDWLRADSDLDNTIVFVFADHGNGLPRYKRWLNDSGLRVPLIVYVPPQFQDLAPHGAGTKTDRLVSFVDFPATAISLAGGSIPEILQGTPFLGNSIGKPRQYVYGARSRADDMFEVSRSVFDGRFLYVRHFMPHLPYIQPGVIFDDRKDSFRELRRLHDANRLPEPAKSLWTSRKPTEELYDLANDPHEIRNLASSSAHAERKKNLSVVMQRWILDHRDSGFLPEAEYQIRAAESGLTPFDVVQSVDHFDLPTTLRAAFRVGESTATVEAMVAGLHHEESGVRYWSAVGLQARDHLGDEALEALGRALHDDSPSVRIAVAEAIAHHADHGVRLEPALRVLGEVLQDDRPWVALQAARAVALVGERGQPLVPDMKAVVNKNRSAPGSRRPYKDFNYASFTGWALETALTACGESDFVAAINGG